MKLHSPMYISARLMAAVRVEDAHGRSEINIEPTRRDKEGRVVWRVVIVNDDGQEIYDAAELRSGVGSDVDARDMMRSLLGFLTAAAEAYRSPYPDSENRDLFPETVMEWAYHYDSELQMLEFDLSEEEEE